MACKTAEVVVPRTGSYSLLEGGVQPDGTQTVFMMIPNDKQLGSMACTK
jgi:hypothetical protein